MAETKEITGKFQVVLIIKEYIDTGDKIELQTLSDYLESCWGWNDVKETIRFFIERVEGKLNGKGK